jgi:hypothetical protein
VSPLDPRIFSTIAEYVKDLLADNPDPKYSPVEVAQWLENLTAASSQALATARLKARSRSSPEFRRMEEDVLIMNGLGRFFAAKLRSGVLFEIFQQTSNRQAGTLALAQYKKARDAWATMANRAGKVYRSDISYGDVPGRRGNWSDRLPGIDRDFQAMQEKLQDPLAASGSAQDAERAIRAATGTPLRPNVSCRHAAPGSFQPGQPLSLFLLVSTAAAHVVPESVRLHYRHVNQGERWTSIEMQKGNNGYTAAIPGNYTDSIYPLQYYFELRGGANAAWLHPALNSALSNQPYYAVDKRGV